VKICKIIIEINQFFFQYSKKAFWKIVSEFLKMIKIVIFGLLFRLLAITLSATALKFKKLETPVKIQNVSLEVNHTDFREQLKTHGNGH
jgi:hypothetical protein